MDDQLDLGMKPPTPWWVQSHPLAVHAEGLSLLVQRKWAEFLEEPEAELVLGLVRGEARARQIQGQTWILGEHLLDAIRRSGRSADNNWRAPLVRYVMATEPTTRECFRLRKRTAA